MTRDEAKALALVAVRDIEAKSKERDDKREALRKTMLSDDEAVGLLRAFTVTRADRGGFTEDEAMALINEATAAKLIACCVHLAIEGLVDVDVDMSKPESDRVSFRYRKELDGPLAEIFREKRRRDER